MYVPKRTLGDPIASLLPTHIASANFAEESQGKMVWRKGCSAGCSEARRRKKLRRPGGGVGAIVAAVAANAANQSPEVAAETVVFLRKQTELLEAQRKTVDAEYEYFEARVGATPARPAAADWIPDLYRAVRDRHRHCYRDPRCHQVTQRTQA
jgi:hypothetical protein